MHYLISNLIYFCLNQPKGIMMEEENKFKEHFKKHRTAYLCALTGAGAVGITWLIMRGRYEALVDDGAYGPKTIDTLVTMRPLSFFSDQTNVVRVIARDGRGHPGYLIRSLNTNEYFSSQREAASVFGISETLLSKHLSGKIEDAEGYKFERLSFAA
jgi:hypothetical protein